MAVIESQSVRFPKNIDDLVSTQLPLLEFVRLRADDMPFIPINSLMFANKHLRTLDMNWGNILEVFAGNGNASTVLLNGLANVHSIKKTDIMEFDGIETLDAITASRKPYETLLMISPPSINGYSDYQCIKTWAEHKKAKYLIFVGELGASDGSEGLYLYLMKHKTLKPVEREVICTGLDPCGDPIVKELFVFEKRLSF